MKIYSYKINNIFLIYFKINIFYYENTDLFVRVGLEGIYE